MSDTPPGWYDDGSGGLRYWDGAAWTEHTAPRYVDPAPALGPQRKAGAWLWLVVGGVAVVLVGVTVGVVLLLSSHQGPVNKAKAALEMYNSAWLNVDCDALQESTTEAFRYDWGYEDCSAFEDDATDFDQVNRDYRTTVDDTSFVSGHVVVTTTESYTDMDGSDFVDHVTYTVVNDGDAWRIDMIDFAGDDEGETDV